MFSEDQPGQYPLYRWLYLEFLSTRGRFADDQVFLCRQEQRTSGSADDALSLTVYAP